ncbi:MAG: ACT domain-containing protein [Verrucomicrobia bacterium]|nr:ACT domain-containing protein [Verrucomicrobiota bacterium]
MNAVRLIAVFAENKPGQTARITRLLAEANINIRWATIANNGAFGVLKFLVDKPDAAFHQLKQNGVMVTFLEALAVEVQDRPGALHTVAEALAHHQINLDNTSGYVADRNRAILIVEVQDVARAATVLEQHKLHLLSQAEMLQA